jgi:hypothetical protein
MKLIKNYLNFIHPESMFLCSQINEENTVKKLKKKNKKNWINF